MEVTAKVPMGSAVSEQSVLPVLLSVFHNLRQMDPEVPIVRLTVHRLHLLMPVTVLLPEPLRLHPDCQKLHWLHKLPMRSAAMHHQIVPAWKKSVPESVLFRILPVFDLL